MKIFSTMAVFLLLQSSSTIATQVRHYLQRNLINHF